MIVIIIFNPNKIIHRCMDNQYAGFYPIMRCFFPMHNIVKIPSEYFALFVLEIY